MRSGLFKFKSFSNPSFMKLDSCFSTISETTKNLGINLIAGSRVSLAKSITLIESSRPDHKEQASLLLNYVAENRSQADPKKFNFGNTLRLGIAGPPGTRYVLILLFIS